MQDLNFHMKKKDIQLEKYLTNNPAANAQILINDLKERINLYLFLEVSNTAIRNHPIPMGNCYNQIQNLEDFFKTQKEKVSTLGYRFEIEISECQEILDIIKRHKKFESSTKFTRTERIF